MTNRMPSTRTRLVPMLAAAVVAVLVVLALPIGVAGASPSPAASTSQTLWAYGAVRTVDFSGTSESGWQYAGNATYGFSVILSQTNTSANGIELTVNRTMGALFSEHYCYPSCQSPRYFGNLTDHVYETLVASANLTSAGTVDENGPTVAAIALNDSHSYLKANVTEASSSYLPTILGLGAPIARSHYLGANVVATSTVSFSPGLGILPDDLSTAQSWNASAAYVAHVAATYTYYDSLTVGGRPIVIGPVVGNLSVPAMGSVSLYGNFTPSDTVNLGGVVYPEVSIKVVGPFDVREGFILVPRASDLFGGSALPWGAHENGTATATMSYLDVRASQGGHLGIGGSAWVYDSSTLGPSSGIPGSSGVAQLTSATGPGSDAAPPTVVQGEPESVPAAQSQQACLLTGAGCPTGGSNGPVALHGLVGLLAVGVVVVVVIAAVLLIAERRRMPPPAYPNAALYPPGATPPGSRASPTTPSPPPEDDPLRNLW
jgi:hypothetical protein